jgi:hypothetical protein
MKAAEKELKRLRSLFYRLKKKQDEEIKFMFGASITNSDFCGWGFGKIGYDKPKNKGGKKQFICTGRVKKRDPITGEVNKVIPPYDTKPHIHMMVYGYGASSCAQYIMTNLQRANKDGKFRKSRLASTERIENEMKYIENQCTKVWEVK